MPWLAARAQAGEPVPSTANPRVLPPGLHSIRLRRGARRVPSHPRQGACLHRRSARKLHRPLRAGSGCRRARGTPHAVAPDNAEQVQAAIRRSPINTALPLWPISCGKNLGYGGAAPRMRGTVVLDLNRMNRILESQRRIRLRAARTRRRATSTCIATSRRRATSCGWTCPTRAGAAWSATRWSAAWATRPTATTS